MLVATLAQVKHHCGLPVIVSVMCKKTMFLNKREISGVLLAPLAAPVVFLLQGGFGEINYSELTHLEFVQSALGFMALSAIVWFPVTLIIGVPVYLYLKKLGYANIFTLTLASTVGCYLMSLTLFERAGSVMFALSGFVVAVVFSLIVRPGKYANQRNT